MKYVIIIAAVMLLLNTVMIDFVKGEGSAPSFKSVGYIVTGRYFDFLNTRAYNLSNITFSDNLAYTTITFSGSVTENSTLNISTEQYQFINSSNLTAGAYKIAIETNNSASYACTGFVTEVNANSTLVTASSCSTSNLTTLTPKNTSYDTNSYNVTTNETQVTLLGSTFSPRTNYIDVLSNATGEDLVIRTRNTTGHLVERIRFKANVSTGETITADKVNLTNANMTLGHLVVPVESIIPENPVDGLVFYNSTSKTLDCYSDSLLRHCGNGTVK